MHVQPQFMHLGGPLLHSGRLKIECQVAVVTLAGSRALKHYGSNVKVLFDSPGIANPDGIMKVDINE
jgi:hypothetical protein